MTQEQPDCDQQTINLDGVQVANENENLINDPLLLQVLGVKIGC